MCDDSNNNHFSRRNFLGSAFTVGAGAFLLNPVRALSEGIADGLILKAHAEATGVNVSRNYINIQLPGGPLRYQFDQWLRLKADDPQLANVASTGVLNPMLGNSFDIDSQGKITAKFQNFTYRNVLTPYLFSQQVYNSGGQLRPLTELLDNMLVIRGFGSGLDGHEFNMIIQQAPIGGVPTISGLVSENTVSTFDSVQWPDRQRGGLFISKKGKAQSKIAGKTPLSTLMEGFATPANTGVLSLKSSFTSAMELAQERLKAYARSENSGSPLVAQNLTSAAAMMKKGVANIGSYWAPAVARYKRAIENSLKTIDIPGISDRRLVSDESSSFGVGTGDIIKVSKTFDLRTALDKASLLDLAEGLALTEYLIKEKLSYSIDIRCSGIANLSLTTVNSDGSLLASSGRTLGCDMHNTGFASAILLMNAFYRGLSAGILELKDQLGADTWRNTVVQVQGDFTRTARSAGDGSDHGFNQMVTSVFSGAFNNGPIVVGNIKKSGLSPTYDGTQGTAAAIDGYNQKGMPTPAMAASTVTALLGVDHNPYANTASPLVSLSNGTLKALATAKIVES